MVALGNLGERDVFYSKGQLSPSPCFHLLHHGCEKSEPPPWHCCLLSSHAWECSQLLSVSHKLASIVPGATEKAEPAAGDKGDDDDGYLSQGCCYTCMALSFLQLSLVLRTLSVRAVCLRGHPQVGQAQWVRSSVTDCPLR